MIDVGLVTGGNPHTEIRDWIDNCRAAIALVSRKYLTRDYIAEQEIPRLRERKLRDPAFPILPFILDRCNWKSIDIFLNATICPNEDRTFEELPDAELHRILLSNVTILEKQFESRNVARAAPRTTSVPSQPETILGREEELKACVTNLENTPVLVLFGAPGQGKSELARYVATTMKDRFSAGVVEVDVQNETQAQNLPGLISERLSLSPDDNIFQALSAHRRLLVLDGFEHILTDNAPEETEGFLRPFIQALQTSGSRAIITSQVSFNRKGINCKPVKPLSEDAASELFHRAAEDEYRATSSDPIARFVIDDLGGHPYSIVIVGKYSKALGIPFENLRRLWWETWSKIGTFRPYLDQPGLATSFELTYTSRPLQPI